MNNGKSVIAGCTQEKRWKGGNWEQNIFDEINLYLNEYWYFVMIVTIMLSSSIYSISSLAFCSIETFLRFLFGPVKGFRAFFFAPST
jgi:hypothetical protein